MIPFLPCRRGRNCVDEVILVPEARHAPARLLHDAQLANYTNLEPGLLEQFTHSGVLYRFTALEATARDDARELRLIAEVEDEQLLSSGLGPLARDVDDDSRPGVQSAQLRFVRPRPRLPLRRRREWNG